MSYLKKCKDHFKIICKHKWYVFIECCKLGIVWQGITHDLSKFSFSEFFISAKYYTGYMSPIDKEKELKGYSYVWLHHRGHNKHHWEYWIDNLSSGGDALKIPTKYVLEMIADWLGAGKAYNSNSTIQSSFDFFIRKYNRGEIKIHLDTYKFIVNLFTALKIYDKHKRNLEINKCIFAYETNQQNI